MHWHIHRCHINRLVSHRQQHHRRLVSGNLFIKPNPWGPIAHLIRQRNNNYRWWGLCRRINLHGAAIAVDYGLFGNLTRPAAFAVEGGEYDHHRVSGVANSPGHPEDRDIYRGKLANLYTIATAVERFCRRYSITLGAITVACDGIEVLRKSMGNENGFLTQIKSNCWLLAFDPRL